MRYVSVRAAHAVATMYAVVLALSVAACATIGFDAETPTERLAAAYGYYALAVEGVNQLHEAGTISDRVLVERIAPVRTTAQQALREAEDVINAFQGQSNDTVDQAIETASRMAANFYDLYREMRQ